MAYRAVVIYHALYQTRFACTILCIVYGALLRKILLKKNYTIKSQRKNANEMLWANRKEE